MHRWSNRGMHAHTDGAIQGWMHTQMGQYRDGCTHRRGNTGMDAHTERAIQGWMHTQKGQLIQYSNQ